MENIVIITAHPEFAQAAVAELKQFEKQITMIEEVASGIVLCDTPDALALLHRAAKERPIFVRHLAPAQTIVDLSNDEQDIGRIATAIAALPTFLQLERGIHFAVQSRLVQTDKSQGERPYTSGRLNQMLAEAFAEETRAVEDIKKPQVIVSLLCTMNKAYIGISTAEENLSAWPGGARHFAQIPEQISRAEFKFLEALESFGLTLPEHGRVLDLGAAPGGWTRLLLEAGLQVVAVDPARMDPRIERHPRLEHHSVYAERYLEEALRRRYKFDAIVSDMRMDARDAARLLVEAAPCLRRDGFILSSFKLPHATREINPLATLREGMRILQRTYAIVQARQLFHNRQEVTVVAAQLYGRNELRP